VDVSDGHAPDVVAFARREVQLVDQCEEMIHLLLFVFYYVVVFS
jgi:hypothetical protein